MDVVQPSALDGSTGCSTAARGASPLHYHTGIPGTCTATLLYQGICTVDGYYGLNYSFGLFDYDSHVSFRASGVIGGIRQLVAELVYLLISSLFLVPALWETNNQDMKTVCTWIARE